MSFNVKKIRYFLFSENDNNKMRIIIIIISTAILVWPSGILFHGILMNITHKVYYIIGQLDSSNGLFDTHGTDVIDSL